MAGGGAGSGRWFAKIDTDPAAGGGLTVDEKFFPHGSDFRGLRVHQVRLQGGDASSDSYCYTSLLMGSLGGTGSG